ncbi:MAG: sialidase family protein [bacterium]
MKKKTAITMLALGMIIFLGAQPQMPHLEALDGPYNAQNMIDMALCRYSPVEPPVIYGVNEDTCFVKTTNRGDSWIILPKGHIYKSGIRCVAVHPTDPDIVYKAEWGSIYQKGIMRSTDGGYFWTLINNGLPDYVIPSKLGIFPHSGYYNYLLLGMAIDQQSHGGYPLYRSTNGGSDWLPVIQWGSDFLNITDFSFDPTVPEIVCLSAKQSSDPGNAYRGVWMSTDFGETWSHIGRPDNMSYPEVTCVAMVDEDIIYAGYWNKKKNEGGIQMATNGGLKWQVLPMTLDNDLIDIYINSNESNNFYLVINSDKGIEILKYDISIFLKRDKKIIIKK